MNIYFYLFVYVLAGALIGVLKDSENPPVHLEKYIVLHIPTCKLRVETIGLFRSQFLHVAARQRMTFPV